MTTPEDIEVLASGGFRTKGQYYGDAEHIPATKKDDARLCTVCGQQRCYSRSERSFSASFAAGPCQACLTRKL